MKKSIYNPLSNDFTTTYDINEDGNPVTYTIQALQWATFEDVIANHIADHLATEVAFKRGWQGSNYEIARKRALEEIYGGVEEQI